MYRTCIPLICFLAFFVSDAYAQKEAQNWYFSQRAGISFQNNNPIALTNGALNTEEGSSSVSDKYGNLLFYTDGRKVWNKNHQLMPNGSGLAGDVSSTQSALIVPQPGNDSIYYIFTVDAQARPNGLCYSIVNMHRAGNLGDITTKNVRLLTPTCEKLSGVRHCNGKDIWVIARLWDSDKYYSYLVSASGLSASPVISSTGFWVGDPARVNDGYEAVGYMKISPNGKKLVAAHVLFTDLELLDFNNATGVLSNMKRIEAFPAGSTTYSEVYGVEFSPNNRYIYLTASAVGINGISSELILQYNITAGGTGAINATRTALDSLSSNLGLYPMAMQLALNGKIYIIRNNMPYLDCINNPDQPGPASNLQQQAVSLAPGSLGIFGLPNFIQSYFAKHVDVAYNCGNNMLQFYAPDSLNLDSVRWNFGDPGSGPANSVRSFSPQHVFSVPGLYHVQALLYAAGNCFVDTVYKDVPAGNLNNMLGADAAICQGDSLRLKPSVSGNDISYLWSDGSTDSVLMVRQAGQYWVKLTIGNCEYRDTINVLVNPVPVFNLGRDTAICQNGQVTLSPSPAYPGAGFLWNTGSVSSSITVNSTGMYWLQITGSNGCPYRDSINVMGKVLPQYNLGPDTSICVQDTLVLNATVNGAASYNWNTGQQVPVIKVYASAVYWCDVDLAGCIYRDSLVLTTVTKPIVNLGKDTTVCQQNALLLDASNTGVSYLWQDGSTNSVYAVTSPGRYFVQVKRGGCAVSDTINISYMDKPRFSLGADKAVCLNVPLILDPQITDVSYLWQDGTRTRTYGVTQPGIYTLTATNVCGDSTDAVKISSGVCDIYIPNSFTPDNNGKNDFFKVANVENITNFHLQVINRYGQIIFDTHNKYQGWDGTFAGAKQPAGSYIYIISYQYISNAYREILQGNLLLLR